MGSRSTRPGLLVAALSAWVGTTAPSVSATLPEELGQQLAFADSGLQVDPGTDRVRALRAFYGMREGEPVFTAPSGLTPLGQTVLNALGEAGREGLDPSDYVASENVTHDDAAKRAGAEIAIGAAYLRYAADLTHGRASPKDVDPELFVFPRTVDRFALLNDLVTTPNAARFLDGLTPSNPNYVRLRRALAAHQRIVAAGGWPSLPEGPTLRLGDKGARIAVLRNRLTASGDLTVASNSPDTFDEGLLLAVQRFQSRHGLDADGLVGAQTQQALNVSVEDRIQQIVANMERWRWMPDDLGDTYVLVNIAGFELEVVEDGRQVLEMPVIVGRRYRRTPVFSGEISFLELNPFWNVPPRIAAKDIVPKVVENPSYLAEQGFRVFSDWSAQAAELDASAIDWASAGRSRLPYKLRQDPGQKNALGRVKFMFPNEHNVYLHDTPTRELFNERVKTFSSGCIRVAKPLELAEYLLREQDWDRHRIEATLESGQTKAVSLQKKVPVHITYSTAWVGEGGTIHFREDIYERDQSLTAALFER